MSKSSYWLCEGVCRASDDVESCVYPWVSNGNGWIACVDWEGLKVCRLVAEVDMSSQLRVEFHEILPDDEELLPVEEFNRDPKTRLAASGWYCRKVSACFP